MIDQKLNEHFHFDETDLQASRNGQFSGKQKNRLFGRHESAVRQKQIAAPILIPLSLLMLTGMVYLICKDIVSGSGSDLGPIILLGLFGGLFLLAGSYIFRISFLGPTYLLRKAEGPINIVKESQLINLAGEVFNLHPDSTVSNVMTIGDTYAIYYSQGVENDLREILSVELISKAKRRSVRTDASSSRERNSPGNVRGADQSNHSQLCQPKYPTTPNDTTLAKTSTAARSSHNRGIPRRERLSRLRCQIEHKFVIDRPNW